MYGTAFKFVVRPSRANTVDGVWSLVHDLPPLQSQRKQTPRLQAVQVLVRDPVAVVASFGEVLEATLEETCFPALCSIVSDLRALGYASGTPGFCLRSAASVSVRQIAVLKRRFRLL